MREIDIVERIRKFSTGVTNPSVVRGIGDDCAIVRPRTNEDLVFTTDFVIEGRHFTLDTSSAAQIGHKALARSLSDLAAMASEPVFCLVSLALPGDLAVGPWIDAFYRGLLSLAAQYGCALAGGDLSQFDNVVADVMCCGRVPRGKALLRSGAKPGDAIYVTGSLGGVHPAQPRIAEGIALRGKATAAIDISDGLVIDLHRLCLQSGVSAEIDEVPVAEGATLDDALYRGEDYELLFTSQVRVRGTRIGTIQEGRAGEIRMGGKRLRVKGWDHFHE